MGLTSGRREIHADLEEALGYIFGCFREGSGPLRFFFSSLFSPWDCRGRHQRRQVGRKEKGSGQQAEELIRPLVLIKLRGVIF